MDKVVFMTRGEGQKIECLIFLGIGIGLMVDCFGFIGSCGAAFVEGRHSLPFPKLLGKGAETIPHKTHRDENIYGHGVLIWTVAAR